MTIRGLSEVESRMAQALRNIEGASRESVTDVILDLLGQSVQRAPVDTGDLRGSGKAIINDVVVAVGNGEGGIVTEGGAPSSGSRVEGSVSFGTEYAIYQHEGLEFRHPQGGQAKYLQQPYEENADRYIQHIADSVRRETR